MKLNLVIPMAGEGSRFGYKFKPFLKLDDRLFIEHVLDPFLLYDNFIESYIFIITEQQELENNIIFNIKNIFLNIYNKINIIIIKNKTDGPYQTILNGLNNKLYENIIICDCDHQIYIEPIINYLLNNDIPDIIIPIWDINLNEQKNWGKIVLNNDIIQNIYEKEELILNKNEKMYGMIGCYYFKNTNIIEYNNYFLNISDFLKKNINNLKIYLCKINKAYFFGTPDMVKKYISDKRCYENIICDVDGVLFKHSPHSNTDFNDNELIGNCVNTLKKWKNDNKKIILMTSRSNNTRDNFIKLLDNKQIIYDELIMGVNPGTRYVLNDIKPSNIFTKQSIEINLLRDTGIDNIECNQYLNNNIKVLDIFKGGSFSKVYLLENNNNKFLRKHIIKNNINKEHYLRLKRQAEDLRRFYYYDNTLVPKFIEEKDSNDDYYYDMEYLEDYQQLNLFNEDIQNKVLNNLLLKMNESIYIYSKIIKEPNKFIDDFFEEKIYPKLNQFSKDCMIMNYLINTDNILINNKEYYGLNNILNKLNIYNFSPSFVCPIHGDLNFENILYNIKTNDIKIIDMEGSRYVDSPVFDLGKIFQSIIGKYEIWSNIEEVIIDNNINNLRCIDNFFIMTDNKLDIVNFFKDIFNKDYNYIIKNGIFYMALYFIRFIPFRLKVSHEHGIFALIMAIIWLNNILLL